MDTNNKLQVRVMNLKTTISFLLSVVASLFSIGVGAQALVAEKLVDPQIKALMANTYYVGTKNGKVSFTKIPLGKEEALASNLKGGGYGQPCQQNLAKLNRPGAAARISDTSYVLAFLDCPAINDGVAEYVVALFNQSNIDSPVCFAVVNQANSGIKFSGYLQEVDVHKSSSHEYHGALTWSYGDAGSWTKGLALVHVTDKCSVTILKQFKSSGGPVELPNCREAYKGTDIEHRFTDATNVEVIESKSMICDTKRTKETVSVTKIELGRSGKPEPYQR